jgi:hypothetical protein
MYSSFLLISLIVFLEIIDTEQFVSQILSIVVLFFCIYLSYISAFLEDKLIKENKEARSEINSLIDKKQQLDQQIEQGNDILAFRYKQESDRSFINGGL